MDYLVNTPCGLVRGAAGRLPGTAAYKGIRYAFANRWEYPKVTEHWDGVYEALEYGPSAMQNRAFFDETKVKKSAVYYNEFRKGQTYTYSEDCLMLNIFAPENAQPGDKLPVMVFFHGGGFIGGCGNENPFDCPAWAQKGCIAVTVNYRLGVFGFLCLPQLKEEAGYTGNYGLYDQVAALQWVQNNIEAFGGDKGNVTILGQSAGAISVQHLCFSPMVKGLFHRAFMASCGGIGDMFSPAPAEKFYKLWQAVMQAAGCEILEQLRKADAKLLFDCWRSLRKQIPGAEYTFPCADGRLITNPGKYHLGDQAHIPYMAGITYNDLFRDVLFQMSNTWCAHQEKGYSYVFDRALPGDDQGAFHCGDLWYWFGTVDNCPRPMEEKDYQISELMQSYLLNFVRTGDPNGEGLPKWEIGSKQKKALRFGDSKPRMWKPLPLSPLAPRPFLYWLRKYKWARRMLRKKRK